MSSSTYSILFSKVLLFTSIMLLSHTSNSSELQPIDVKIGPYPENHFVAQQERTNHSNTVNIPLNSLNHEESSQSPGAPNKEPPVRAPNSTLLIMEGGGAVVTEDHGTEHSKGSKGRKGVERLQSSVVARKGADPEQLHNPSVAIPKEENNDAQSEGSTAQLSSPTQQSVTSSGSIKDTSKLEQQHKVYSAKHKLSEDPDDDFDKYPWIKSSTTGEDYVIIGIVIIIGIWFSVFGALIFYRRAGEYWDRRHYRRMDFLVEGMYND